MSRRLLVTTKFEVEEEDDVLKNRALTDLARVIEEDLINSNGDGFLEFIESTIVVDVQMMPRTYGDEGHPDSPSYRESNTTQSFVFPPEHELHELEKAFRVGDQEKISSELLHYRMLARGND